MPTQEPGELINLFISLHDSSTVKSKVELLAKSKQYIFNQMSDEEVELFFVKNGQNFKNFLQLDIWTASLDDKNGIVEFLEPYDIIEKIFSLSKTLVDFLGPFNDNLIFLLNQSADEKVKHMAVKHLITLMNNLNAHQAVYDVEFKNRLGQLLTVLVRQIPNTSASYTKLLAEFMCLLAMNASKIDAGESSNAFLSYIIAGNTNLTREIEHVAGLNETQRFRIMEIVVKLACVSSECLSQICEKTFNLTEKIQFYVSATNNDTLAKLNCIEMLTWLVETEHGLDYLQHNRTLKQLVDCLNNVESDPFGMILLPTLVKFFSNIARRKPGLLLAGDYTGYYEFLFRTTVEANFARDPESINLAIETFSFLFESNLMKKFFAENFRPQFDQLIDTLVRILKSSINDRLRVSTVTCMAELVSVDPTLLMSGENTDEKWSKSSWIRATEWSTLAKDIYGKFVQKYASHENLFRLFLEYAKQPFVDKRLAAQLYFKALAQSDWGVTFLFAENEFNREHSFLNGYLLNRAIELEKEGLESKYELIKLLVVNVESNVNLIQLVGENYLVQLKAYVQEGPFFSRAQSRVAFENV